jgi:hypothetical protein
MPAPKDLLGSKFQNLMPRNGGESDLSPELRLDPLIFKFEPCMAKGHDERAPISPDHH